MTPALGDAFKKSCLRRKNQLATKVGPQSWHCVSVSFATLNQSHSCERSEMSLDHSELIKLQVINVHQICNKLITNTDAHLLNQVDKLPMSRDVKLVLHRTVSQYRVPEKLKRGNILLNSIIQVMESPDELSPFHNKCVFLIMYTNYTHLFFFE